MLLSITNNFTALAQRAQPLTMNDTVSGSAVLLALGLTTISDNDQIFSTSGAVNHAPLTDTNFIDTEIGNTASTAIASSHISVAPEPIIDIGHYFYNAWSRVNGNAVDLVENIPAPYRETFEGRPVVVIDLGHGDFYRRSSGHHILNTNAQSIGSHLNEMEVVDAVAPYLKAELERRGFIVAYTRNPNEAFVNPLTGNPYFHSERGFVSHRARFAANLCDEMNAASCTLVSLHANGDNLERVSGSDVFYRTPRGLSDGRDRLQPLEREDSSRNLARHISENYIIPTDDETGAFRRSDLGVLNSFQRAVDNNNYMSRFNAGTRHNPFDASGSVTDAAAVLLELGYLSNRQDDAVLQRMAEDTQFAAEVAYDIANGIELSYHERNSGAHIDYNGPRMIQ